MNEDTLFDDIPINCAKCGRPLTDGVCLWCNNTPSHTLVRNNDPSTSHAAAQSIGTTDLEILVYNAIKNAGERGMTADELLHSFPHLSYSSVTARPSALKRKGLIYDSGEKRVGKSGRSQAVLKATKQRASEPHDMEPRTGSSVASSTCPPCPDCGTTLVSKFSDECAYGCPKCGFAA